MNQIRLGYQLALALACRRKRFKVVGQFPWRWVIWRECFEVLLHCQWLLCVFFRCARLRRKTPLPCFSAVYERGFCFPVTNACRHFFSQWWSGFMHTSASATSKFRLRVHRRKMPTHAPEKMTRDLFRALSLAPRQKYPRNVEMKEAMAAFFGSDSVATSCHCKRSKIFWSRF